MQPRLDGNVSDVRWPAKLVAPLWTYMGSAVGCVCLRKREVCVPTPSLCTAYRCHTASHSAGKCLVMPTQSTCTETCAEVKAAHCQHAGDAVLARQKTCLEALFPASASVAEEFQVRVWLVHTKLLGDPIVLICSAGGARGICFPDLHRRGSSIFLSF